MDIVNAIGKIFYVDPQFLGARDKRIVWILIEKEYMGGFSDHIELHWEFTHLLQRLNF